MFNEKKGVGKSHDNVPLSSWQESPWGDWHDLPDRPQIWTSPKKLLNFWDQLIRDPSQRMWKLIAGTTRPENNWLYVRSKKVVRGTIHSTNPLLYLTKSFTLSILNQIWGDTNWTLILSDFLYMYVVTIVNFVCNKMSKMVMLCPFYFVWNKLSISVISPLLYYIYSIVKKRWHLY
jgi:hypothetical protein